MSNISSKNTKPEILVRKYLFQKGFRYRKNVKNMPGKPDIVLKKYNTTIFINGCFWHGHKNCNKSKLPETRKDFWQKKILNNINRDKNNIDLLLKKGWKVLVIWGCEIKNKTSLSKTLDSIITTTLSSSK